LERVSASILRYSLLEGGERVLVGVSGGPDSVCLLHLLHRLKERFEIDLHSVYVNHNLRPGETGNEILLCRSLAQNLGVDFTVKSIDVRSFATERRLNIQEAARELRYKAFEEAALEKGADRVALAHHADDQVETFIMRLLRGAGSKGLSGMPAKRGKFIRPLIDINKKDIEEFLAAEDIPFVVDSSNLKRDYLRNKIRYLLLPSLKEINPNLNETILHTAQILGDDAQKIELFLVPLESMETVLLRRLLKRAIESVEGLRGIGFTHIEDILQLIKKGRHGDRLYLPKGVRAIKDYSLLVLTSLKPVVLTEHDLRPGETLVMKDAGIAIRALTTDERLAGCDGKSSILLDAGSVVFPLKVRRRTDGDFFYPLGFGKRKKLQDFFVDEKVPRDERDGIPVVLSGGDIVWIAGYRGDDRFRVKDSTESFLRLDLLKSSC
jgi:tRNA(Ile)-lysidine synthase